MMRATTPTFTLLLLLAVGGALRAEDAPAGTLEVRATRGATVLLDGVELGAVKAKKATFRDVPAGNHLVELTWAEAEEPDDPVRTAPRFVTVTPGKKKTILRVESCHEQTVAQVAAIGRGLDWLVSMQQADGGWDLPGLEASLGTELPDAAKGWKTTGNASLVILAFVGAGHRPGGESAPAGSLTRGLEYLLAQKQAKRGYAEEGMIRSHALATQALVLAAALCQDEAFAGRLSAAAQEAVETLLGFQGEDGGWGETPDSRTRGWQTSLALQALHLARLAGHDVDDEALTKALSALDHLTASSPPRTGFAHAGDSGARTMAAREYPGHDTITAMALVARLHAGANPRRDDKVEGGLALLAKDLPKWDESALTIEFEYWQHATLALSAASSAHHKAWAPALDSALLPHQDAKGSWPPRGAWSSQGGRIHSTAASLLALTRFPF